MSACKGNGTPRTVPASPPDEFARDEPETDPAADAPSTRPQPLRTAASGRAFVRWVLDGQPTDDADPEVDPAA